MAKGYFGTLDWGNWLYGLFAGFIGGGAGAVSTGVAATVIDPRDFNIYGSKIYALIFATFTMNGLIAAFMFLKQKPLPDHIKVVSKVEEVQQAGHAAILTKSVETTVVSTPEPPA